MRIFILSFLAVLLGSAAISSHAAAGEFEDACASLERPNIDCACVGKRVSAMQDIAADDTAAGAIGAYYTYYLGLDQTITEYGQAENFAVTMLDSETRLQQSGFDAWPDELADFEEVCVKAGAPVIDIPPLPEGSAEAEYVRNCEAAGTRSRLCQCWAPRISSHMKPEEFSAWVRDYSDYLGKASTQPKSDRHGELMDRARMANKPYEDLDFNYCQALTFADDMSGTDDADRAALRYDMPAESGPLETGADIAADYCAKDGNSEAYCQCFVSEFNAQAGPPEQAKVVAALAYGDYLPPSKMVEAMDGVGEDVMNSAVFAMMAMDGLGETCPQ